MELSDEDGRMILKWVVMELVRKDTDWIRVAQDRACKVFNVSCYKYSGKLGTVRRRWEDDIKMDRNGISTEGYRLDSCGVG